MRRAFVITALVLISAVGMATPALAHTELISANPADGAQLDTAPSMVTLTFNEPIQGDGDLNQVAITGPDGGQWTEGQVEVRDTVVTTRVRPLGPAGDYTIGYRVVSADGHPVSGEISFTLTIPGTGTSAPPAATTSAPGTATAGQPDNDAAGVPVWVWIAGAVVLLAAGLGLALRMGRHNP